MIQTMQIAIKGAVSVSDKKKNIFYGIILHFFHEFSGEYTDFVDKNWYNSYNIFLIKISPKFDIGK